MKKLDPNSEHIIYWATKTQFEFPLPPEAPEGTVFKLSARAELDPSLPAMFSATGTISGTVVSFLVNTWNQTFRDVCDQKKKAWLEVYADDVVFLQQEFKIRSRAADISGIPPSPITLYYTKDDVDRLLAAKITLPSGGTAGQLLAMTSGGTLGWTNAGRGTVISVNGLSPDAQGNVTLTAGSVGALALTGGTLQDATIAGTITMGDEASISGDVSVDGTVNATRMNTNTLVVNEGSTFYGDVTAGNVDIQGSLTVSGGTIGQFLRQDAEGKVTLQGATASDVGAAPAAVEIDGGTVTAATIAKVKSGHNYTFGELSSLSINEIEYCENETNVTFLSGNTATVLTIPQIVWIRGEAPEIGTNATYWLNFYRGSGVWGEFKEAD